MIEYFFVLPLAALCAMFCFILGAMIGFRQGRDQ